MSDLTEMKSAFRKDVRANINKLTAEQMKASDIAITEQFIKKICLGSGARVYAYVPYGKEISTLPLLSYFRKQGVYVTICWDWPMDRYPQPEDVIVVPGLTFDKSGYRIGKGGGFYDRLLAKSPDSISVGLARDSLLVDAVPREPHDRRVELLITETQIFDFRSAANGR
ncbi:MAG: hypothetical protein LBD85_04445 [Oscillospiraceae bacterium]|jgi:5-formyltetrahydrofolate cyclo-ligase|nr:hypothetical protein [Oscillospiraceae bacterium]